MKLLVFLFLASVPTALGEFYRCASNTKKGFPESTAIAYDQSLNETTGTRTYTVTKENTDISGTTCRGNVEGTTLPADTMPVEGLTLNMLQDIGNGNKTITNLSLTWGTVNFDSFLVRHECYQQPYMQVTTGGTPTCHVVGLASSGSLNCHKDGVAGNGNYFQHVDADCSSLSVSVIIGGLKDCGTNLSTAEDDRKRTLTFTANNWCGDEFTNVTVDAKNDTIVVSFGGVAATQDTGSNTSIDGWTNTSNDLTTTYDISVADVSFNLYDTGTTTAAKALVNGSSYDLNYVYTSSHTPDAQFTKTVQELLDCLAGTHKSQNHACDDTTDPWGSSADGATETTNATTKTKEWKYSKEMNCNTVNAADNDCCFSAQFVLSTASGGSCRGTAANRRALSSPQVSGRWLQLSDNAFTETSRAFTMRVLRQSEVDNAGVDVTVAVEDEDSGVAGWVPPVAVAALLICAALVYTLTRSPKMLQRALGPATKVLPTE